MRDTQDNKKPPFPYHRYQKEYQILGGITLILILLWLGSVFVGSNNAMLEGNALAYWTNVFTEILGVLVTIAVINQILMAREHTRLKKQLIRQAASPSQAVATEAIAQLREEGWLSGEDGLLQGANLRGANLKGADLSDANLKGANLFEANLASANLGKANLESADLRDCNLRNARLGYARLVAAQLDGSDMSQATGWEADFSKASLQNVIFVNSNSPLADFTDAILDKADLQGSHLKNSRFIRTNIGGTNFTGCNLIGCSFENPSIGSVFAMMPENKVFLTVLPDGRAIVTEENIDAYVDDITKKDIIFPYDNFVYLGDIDLHMYTDSRHPQNQNWKYEWNKTNYREQLADSYSSNN